ncbi:DNA-binding response regulator, OmpR family, containing REC and winged-helix (wHTH) domain [Bartonella sp. CDC_skunk]|uniref:response regulator transcription factor n=1 Tax=unclassified Bartonella TaxID=2645622 RepID=UPI00099A892C|nr:MULTISPECIES: response regulator transcription factor [unclassified Bartonella]AQX21997.1 DNA-binding response regulator, OmpR family, containing REC and winged-helix (wHTH) domain [Bartonella sp. CDC_skunk]AQX27270.1 DNA-binding response regulator, OmpR family, containing REC and winged-helix (wHTH) domain [Bartonella sp. Raccoon60]
MKDYTLLIVVDDNDLRSILVEQLQIHKEFEVLQAKTTEIGIIVAQKDNVDLAIFDVELPDLDGREAVKKLRSQGFRAPIIMMTHYDTDCDTILGFKMGVNDYVTKPFRFSVLLARIRAQLRQYEHNEDSFDLGPYIFKPREKFLIDQQNNIINLTEKETAILKYLYETRDKIVSRETLLEHVWGYNANIITHTLETHIYRLRKKIEKDPSKAKILVTDHNGYRLNL